MTAAVELLQAAKAAGARFAITGDKVLVTAPRPLPRDLVEDLRREKPALIRLLSTGFAHPEPDEDEFDPDDPVAWRNLLRRCIAGSELCGQRPRAEAEVLGYGACLVRWHLHHRTTKNPERCAACGDPFTNADTFNIDPGVLVHFRLDCIRRYGVAARVAAIAGLRAFGIEPPEGFGL